MKTEITGDDVQVALIDLSNGEFIQAEAGSLFFMEGDVDMDIRSPGGWVGGLKRMFVGESFMLPIFKAKSDNCKVALSPPYPGKIVELDIENDKTWKAQKSSFLFAKGNVKINVAFVKKFGAGIFGGEGFVLQEYKGDGKVFIHCGGLAIEKTLKENETVQIDTGCIAAFEETINYDVKRIKNIKSMIFGGEGLFLSTLTGPGKIILQSLPFSRFREVLFTGAANTNPLGSLGTVLGGD